MSHIDDTKQVEQLYDELMAEIRRYHPSKDLSLVERAYKLAREAHGEQKRKSGEPYICLLYTSPSPRDRG